MCWFVLRWQILYHSRWSTQTPITLGRDHDFNGKITGVWGYAVKIDIYIVQIFDNGAMSILYLQDVLFIIVIPSSDGKDFNKWKYIKYVSAYRNAKNPNDIWIWGY